MSEANYVAARREVAAILRELGDEEYASRFPDAMALERDFDASITILEAQNCLDGSAERSIGKTLLDANEADALNRLAASFDVVLGEVGRFASGAMFLSHPEWAHVQAAARIAATLLEA